MGPIYIEIVDNIDELGDKTERGDGGFGSTGKI
jgi:dUTPase